MKYLEIQELSSYNCLLDGLDVGNAIVHGKIEVYSCDKSSEEIKLAKELEHRINMERAKIKQEYKPTITTRSSNGKPIPVNVPYGSTIMPVLSPLASSPVSSPTHMHGIFQGVRMKTGKLSPQQPHYQTPFGSLTLSSNRSVFVDLIAALNESFPDYEFSHVKPEDFSSENLEHLFNSVNLSLRDALESNQRVELWNVIDSSICLADCDLFTYNPEEDDDPMALGEGKIWSWNYFFYNKKQKKLLFFTCHAKSKVSCSDSFDLDADYESFYSNPKNAQVHMRARAMDSDDEDMDFDDL